MASIVSGFGTGVAVAVGSGVAVAVAVAVAVGNWVADGASVGVADGRAVPVEVGMDVAGIEVEVGWGAVVQAPANNATIALKMTMRLGVERWTFVIVIMVTQGLQMCL